MKHPTIAAYGRVSTNDKGQNTEVQLLEIRSYATQRGWTIAKDNEYVDVISGTREHRPQLDRLLADIRRGRVTIIVIVRLDRLSRSLKHLVNLLAELNEYKVALVSIKEGLDFTTPTGRLLFHVIAALAEFERDLISERVKGGIAYAKFKGVRVGRPVMIDATAITKIHELKAHGASLRAIAQSVGVSRSAVHKIVARNIELTKPEISSLPKEVV